MVSEASFGVITTLNEDRGRGQGDPSPRKRDRRSAGLSPFVSPTDNGRAFITLAINDGSMPPPTKLSRVGMYDTYQPWALQTYGEQAKTKTITRNKYQRILQILRGDYIDNESSKFKMWVKGRGFRIGPPPGCLHGTVDGTVDHSTIPFSRERDTFPDIYVQTGTIKDLEGNDNICFKKVAIVEDFFEIVYNLHVCRNGKEQKHMGQKRTYRAVSERYAFVPREAVTKFLVLCTECPRRSVSLPVSLGNGKATLKPQNERKSIKVTSTAFGKTSKPSSSPRLEAKITSSEGVLFNANSASTVSRPKNNFSSVISLVGNDRENEFPDVASKEGGVGLKRSSLDDRFICVTSAEPPLFRPLVTSAASIVPTVVPISPIKIVKMEKARPLTATEFPKVVEFNFEKEDEDLKETLFALSTKVDFALPITTMYKKHMRNKRNFLRGIASYKNLLLEDTPLMAEGSDDPLKTDAHESKRTIEWAPFQSQDQPTTSQKQQELPIRLSRSTSPVLSGCASPGSPERTSRGGPLDGSNPGGEETMSNGNKDDEDDDNDDENEEEKIDAHYDPERLKAFNMFVRLFVDENLDRIVPISKQPKEKIQAIIDACSRQFPEFAERTRKRIRTYLKSCRRNKRTRDSNAWENSRPTPPHLTSIQAEQILATACENEAQNAKRMRIGLEPVSQPNPLASLPTISQSQIFPEKALTLMETSSVETLEKPTVESKGINGSSIFQSSVRGCQTVAADHQQHGMSAMLISSGVSSSDTTHMVGNSSSECMQDSSAVHMMANGPTDLSIRGTGAKSKVRPSLNAVEVAAVRQLITGYRESAAFLLRSADELENLLVHQQNH